MTTTTTARNTHHPRQPWMDELARLRWLEQQMTRLAGGFQHTAAELRDTITGFADTVTRDQCDLRAVELDGAAEAIAALINDSHAGPPAGTDLDWAAWHVGEAGYHLARAAKHAVEAPA
jgi:hypothetical protein